MDKLGAKLEFEGRKLKFELAMLHFLGKESKFWGLMVSKVILGFD